MDGMMLVRGGRSTSASSTERTLLLGALASCMGVLDTRENDAQTIIRKSELWNEITRHFNANASTPRSRQQIQTLYKNMKAKARRYEVRLSEVSSGVPPPDPDPISEMLLGLLHQQMQHQRRHLEKMMTTDVTTSLEDDPFKFSHHLDPSFVYPEQMMQMSMKEGLTVEIDIKNEPQDELDTPEKVSDEVTSDSDQFTDSANNDHSSLPSNTTQTRQTSEVTLNSDTLSETSSMTAQPMLFKCSPPKTNHFQDQTVFAPESGTAPGQPTVSHSHNSPHTVGPINASSSSLASDNHTSNDVFPIVKKAKLVGRKRLPEGRYGEARPQVKPLCCCPDLHAKILLLAQEEHRHRMNILKRDSELQAKEHNARMKILALEEEVVKGKLQTLKESASGGDSLPCLVPDAEADKGQDG